ncbi:MAG: ATP-binding cassette domain-containing protein, partial [Ruthenibacterium sp.]
GADGGWIMSLVLHHLTKCFGDVPVLSDVNVSFADGDVVCVMAPSGAGKTTLVNLLLGLLKPDSGTIDGAEHTRFACAFQGDRLIAQLTAAQNLKFACGALADAVLSDAFSAVGLAGETLTKPVALLSGGEQRRIALLRAMLAPADFVLLDEPFKGLDDAQRAAAAAFVLAQRRGRTLVCITHDDTDAAALGARIWKL